MVVCFGTVGVTLWSRYQKERGAFSYAVPIRMTNSLSGGPIFMLLDNWAKLAHISFSFMFSRNRYRHERLRHINILIHWFLRSSTLTIWPLYRMDLTSLTSTQCYPVHLPTTLMVISTRLVLWPTKFKQGSLCNRWFESTLWSPERSTIGAQPKTVFLSLQKSTKSQYFICKGVDIWIPLPLLTNCS